MQVKRWFSAGLVLAAATCLLAPAPPAQAAGAAGYELKTVLKEMDRAVKGKRWLAASARWDERLEARSLEGSGEVWIDLAGRLRAEVTGDSPRTILVTPPHIHVYTPDTATAKTHSTVFQPDQIAQHVLVGFAPAGSGLKKSFKITIQRVDELDGRQALMLILAPKPKEMKALVDFIHLWVDVETWLPAQVRIRHKETRIEGTVRWLTLEPRDEMAGSLFVPRWPAGTKLIKPEFSP